MTGGWIKDSVSKLSSVYHPDLDKWCDFSLADLPQRRSHHTVCGQLLCGGETFGSGTASTCLKWDGWKFIETKFSLKRQRRKHLCWTNEDKGTIFLLGGEQSRKSKETVWLDGSKSNESTTSEPVLM